jgi:hypothetical protein
MQTDALIRKAGGGRLSREDQRRLGDILQRVYDDVVRQGVPDRFKELLGELEGHKESADPNNPSAEAQGDEGSHESGGLMAARGFPQSKGSAS